MKGLVCMMLALALAAAPLCGSAGGWRHITVAEGADLRTDCTGEYAASVTAGAQLFDVMTVLGALGEVSTGVRAEGGVQLSPSQIQAFAQKGWRDPATNALRCEGPFDLLASALDTGERLAAAARGYWQGCITRAELEAATGNLSYLSGADCRRAL